MVPAQPPTIGTSSPVTQPQTAQLPSSPSTDLEVDPRYSLDDDLDDLEESDSAQPVVTEPPSAAPLDTLSGDTTLASAPMPDPASGGTAAVGPAAAAATQEAPPPEPQPPAVDLGTWARSTELLLRQCPWQEAASLQGPGADSALLQPLLAFLEQLVRGKAAELRVGALIQTVFQVPRFYPCLPRWAGTGCISASIKHI